MIFSCSVLLLLSDALAQPSRPPAQPRAAAPQGQEARRERHHRRHQPRPANPAPADRDLYVTAEGFPPVPSVGQPTDDPRHPGNPNHVTARANEILELIEQAPPRFVAETGLNDLKKCVAGEPAALSLWYATGTELCRSAMLNLRDMLRVFREQNESERVTTTLPPNDPGRIDVRDPDLSRPRDNPPDVSANSYYRFTSNQKRAYIGAYGQLPNMRQRHPDLFRFAAAAKSCVDQGRTRVERLRAQREDPNPEIAARANQRFQREDAIRTQMSTSGPGTCNRQSRVEMGEGGLVPRSPAAPAAQ